MKLWTLTTLWTLSLLILSGCAVQPAPSKNDVIDSTLPIVQLTKNGVYSETNAIAFEWKSIDDARVKGVYVYKFDPTNEEEMKNELTHYSTIQNRFATHFVDENVKADTKYKYMFKTFSEDAKSQSSRTINATSSANIDSVSWIHSIAGMPRAAKIIWRPHSNKKVKTYVIERKLLKEKKFQEIARVEGRLNVEFIDSDLKDNYVYSYRVRVLTYDDILSNPSKIVNVITKPLPAEITTITATLDLPQKIELRWSQAVDADFVQYLVYRSDSKDGSYKLIAKLRNAHHTDVLKEDSQKYYYRVSVIDRDGLESRHDRNSVVGATLGKPKAPVSVEATLLGSQIELSWSNVDERVEYFVIQKVEREGWLSSVTTNIKNVTSQIYFDKAIKANTTYVYTIYGVDANSILSKASIRAQVKTPESKLRISSKKVKSKKEVKVLKKETLEPQGETVTPVKDLDLSEI